MGHETRELEPLQAEANRSGRTLPVEISYDLSGQRVLWHTDVPSGSVTCELADRDRAFRGLRFEDGKALEEARRQAEHVRRVEEDRKRAHKAHEARREREARSSVPATDTRTVAQIRADNAAARHSERQAERGAACWLLPLALRSALLLRAPALRSPHTLSHRTSGGAARRPPPDVDV